jgi:hypothetical protein
MPSEIQLSKMQRIRKRELRRAITKLHENIKEANQTSDYGQIYGLRVAISIIGKMRKEIDSEL